MKYFIDTEFLEGPQKEKFPISLFRKNTPPTIDLISIGVVCEDGREYYAISKDFNLDEAWNRYDLKPDIDNGGYKKVYWIRENVLKPIWKELMFKDVLQDGCEATSKNLIETGELDSQFTKSILKRLLSQYGKTNKQISSEIIQFVMDPNNELWNSWVGSGDEYFKVITEQNFIVPEFYAYFADYDWVVFCWLFGKMMDLPKGFPKYCNDLKQMLEEKANKMSSKELSDFVHGTSHNVFSTLDFGILKCSKSSLLKDSENYPKQDPSKSHNAIEDARWNKQLFDFLKGM